MEAEVKLTMMMSRHGGDSVWLGNWWGAGRDVVLGGAGFPAKTNALSLCAAALSGAAGAGRGDLRSMANDYPKRLLVVRAGN